MDKVIADVQERLNSHSKYEDEHDRKVQISGARTVFNYAAYEKEPGSFQNTTKPVFEELGISDASLSPVEEKVCNALKDLSEGKKARAWISDILNPQLNIAVRTYPAVLPWIIQVLFLGLDREPFILSLFPCDTEASDELMTEVRNFSRRTARMITSSLMNFCHTEFFLVPIASSYSGTFDVEKLLQELDEQMRRASEFYGGPTKLSSESIEELTKAMDYAMRSTTVPCALRLSGEAKPDNWILLLDSDLHKVVVHLLNILECGAKQQATEPCHLTFEPQNDKNSMIVVLEVARRLSFRHQVVVVSKNQELHETVEKLAEELEKNHGLPPFLSSVQEDLFLTRNKESKVSGIIIAFDAPKLMDIPGVLLTVTESPSQVTRPYSSLPDGQTFKPEKVRLLLVGVTGAGRSATANTLLGKQLFKTGIAFRSITESCETHQNVNEGVLFEVTESPGLSTKYPFSTFYSDTQSRTYDAICYVVKIDRFTRKDKRNFQNVKAVLGEKVVQHTIVIFTCGDIFEKQSPPLANENQDGAREHSDKKIEEDLTAELKEILKECGERYVVFNNKSSEKALQTRRFLEILQDLKKSLDDESEAFTCPIMEEARQPAIA